jgi:hypothetical protein
MKIFKLTILLLLFSNLCSAHQDFYVTKIFGKVTVKFKTGYHYEEINNAFFIGQYCDAYLSKYTKNDQEFLLYFDHFYVGKCEPNFFINFSKGEYTHLYSNGSDENKPFLKKKGIVIWQIASSFNLFATLNLLEYSVGNIESIKKTQKKIIYKENYRHMSFLSVDTFLTKKVVFTPSSENINKIAALKFYKENKPNALSYYMSNGEYGIFKKNEFIVNVKRIEAFFQPNMNEILIFTNRNQFMYVKYNERTGKVSIKYHTLNKSFEDGFEPLQIKIDKTNFEIVERRWGDNITHHYDPINDILTLK